MKSKSILISGAGIAGPTLAYWLLRGGFEPVLVEGASHVRQGGYMIDFWGVGFDVADRMNLIPQLFDVGYVIDHLRFVNEDGSTASQLGGDAARRAMGDRFISLPRGDLALSIFAEIEGQAEVRFGDSIASIHEDDAGVDVTLASGAEGRFDLVVGCDGLHSAVRAMRFGPEARFEKFLSYYAASFVTTGYCRRDEHTYLSFAAPGRQISRYALRGDRTAFLIVFSSERPIEPNVDRRALIREQFSHDTWIELPEILHHLDQTDDLYFDAVSQIRMTPWSKGRVALVGDAAFCPSLLAGEGSAFAMLGAYILAGELAAAGGGHDVAFKNYQRRLRGFIDRKQASAERFASSFAPRTRFGIFLRNQVLRLGDLPIVGPPLLRRFVADDFSLPDYAAMS